MVEISELLGSGPRSALMALRLLTYLEYISDIWTNFCRPVEVGVAYWHLKAQVQAHRHQADADERSDEILAAIVALWQLAKVCGLH